MARMKRASTPVEEATDWIAVDISSVSSSELLATFHCVHESAIMALFASNLIELVRLIRHGDLGLHT